MHLPVEKQVVFNIVLELFGCSLYADLTVTPKLANS